VSLYFKVLRNGRSFHQSDMAYPLPVKDVETGVVTPGDWIEYNGKPEICSCGFHLTTDPKEWWGNAVTAYVAEYEGKIYGKRGDKICVKKVRLLRKASAAELEAAQIFTSGHHEAKTGKMVGYDNATIVGYGNATIEGYGNATIEGYDNATIKGYDNATIKGYDNATIEGYGNATIKGYGNATIEGYDNATIKGYDNATIKGYGNATIKGYGNATIKGYDNATIVGYGNATIEGYGNATIEGYDNATITSTRWHGVTAVVTSENLSVHIDRRGSVIKIIVGGTSYEAVSPAVDAESEAAP
jgi:hypothetical protein